MTADWLLRVGDGENFAASSKHRIWGIQSNNSFGKYFLKNVKKGDRLWFVTCKTNGKILAVATYESYNSREFGPLIDLTLSNEDLGWINNGPKWSSDTEIHYYNLYGLNDCELLTHIKGPSTIRKYDDKCRVDLNVEYSNIVRYSKMTFEL